MPAATNRTANRISNIYVQVRYIAFVKDFPKPVNSMANVMTSRDRSRHTTHVPCLPPFITMHLHGKWIMSATMNSFIDRASDHGI